uniref:Uncharacterized protein n=1 Tax=Lactuca sativa TaxID=4236 RepID=A0A9R1W2D9_LACSA|nr:hypothetical protein LSAT_V11C300133170 [Lactuca sativa]
MTHYVTLTLIPIHIKLLALSCRLSNSLVSFIHVHLICIQLTSHGRDWLEEALTAQLQPQDHELSSSSPYLGLPLMRVVNISRCSLRFMLISIY